MTNPGGNVPFDPARPAARDTASADRSARRALTASDATRSSYYGVPVIHKPHWKWLIIVYFFLGGIAGAAYVVAAIADAIGAAPDRRIVRTGRYLSLAALIPSPVLLILDLGRPERFTNMLRVLKLRSPMSVGTWGLTGFGGFCAASAAIQAAQDGLLGDGRLARRVSRLPAGRIGALGVPLALFVAGYTGVLLAATAVPLWTKRALFLGPLFVSSALSTAVSAIIGILAAAPGTRPDTLDRLERLEVTAVLSELSLLTAWLTRLGPTARPLTEGTTGALVRHGVVGAGLVLPLWLHAAKRRLPPTVKRPLTVLASVLVLAGGFMLRYAVVVGGHASADDPQATFELTAAETNRGSS